MTQAPAACDGMVVYDGVSKFFPVRVRPGSKDRPELMVALDRIDATVRKGELITLLGPSGCWSCWRCSGDSSASSSRRTMWNRLAESRHLRPGGTR